MLPNRDKGPPLLGQALCFLRHAYATPLASTMRPASGGMAPKATVWGILSSQAGLQWFISSFLLIADYVYNTVESQYFPSTTFPLPFLCLLLFLLFLHDSNIGLLGQNLRNILLLPSWTFHMVSLPSSGWLSNFHVNIENSKTKF